MCLDPWMFSGLYCLFTQQSVLLCAWELILWCLSVNWSCMGEKPLMKQEQVDFVHNETTARVFCQPLVYFVSSFQPSLGLSVHWWGNQSVPWAVGFLHARGHWLIVSHTETVSLMGTIQEWWQLWAFEGFALFTKTYTLHHMLLLLTRSPCSAMYLSLLFSVHFLSKLFSMAYFKYKIRSHLRLVLWERFSIRMLSGFVMIQ